MAEASVEVTKQTFQNFAQVKVTDREAEELFDAFKIKEEIKYKCVKYSPSRTNSAGKCLRYSNEVKKIIKSVPSVYCEKTALGDTTCNFSTQKYDKLINGEEVLISDSYGLNISNNIAKYLIHLPEQTFETSNRNLRIRCETLVLNRYYDCFVKVK